MSAITPLQIALDAALQGDAILAPKLRGEKIYSLTAPSSDDAMPYIVFGQSSEIQHPTFGRKGHDGIETITAWANDKTKFTVADLANDIERILDAQPLSVNGHYVCTGKLEVVAITIDPTGMYSLATCHYEVTSFEQ